MLQVSEQEVKKRLKLDNPWWERGAEAAVRYDQLPRREYFDPFFALVQQEGANRAVVLMGPRRVGKTVMIHHAVAALLKSGVPPQRVVYVSVDTPVYTGLTLERFVQWHRDVCAVQSGDRCYFFFDEIQYHPAWETHLKSLVDRMPGCRFTVSGSAGAALRLKSKESGAGRFTDFMLPPLSFFEYLRFSKRQELTEKAIGNGSKAWAGPDIESLNHEFINYLNYGGYPEAVFQETVRADPERFIKSDIIDKVLLRDLPSLYGIEDIQELNRLFTNIAYNSGKEVNLEGLSRTAGIAKGTIKRYIEYLEAAFLVRRMQRIDHGAKHFQRERYFKVYLTNPSLRAALFGPVEPNNEACGSLVETAIFGQWQHHALIEDLFYARWSDGEVDFVYLDPATQKPVWAIEVKWSDKVQSDQSELHNLLYFYSKNARKELMLTLTTRSHAGAIKVGNAIVNLVPSALFALTVSQSLVRANVRSLIHQFSDRVEKGESEGETVADS